MSSVEPRCSTISAMYEKPDAKGDNLELFLSLQMEIDEEVQVFRIDFMRYASAAKISPAEQSKARLGNIVILGRDANYLREFARTG